MNFNAVDKWFIPEDPTHSVLVVRDQNIVSETIIKDDGSTETIETQRAIWRKKIHVHYDANNSNATGSTPDSFFRYGLNWKANVCGFEVENATFIKWNSQPDGSGVDYNFLIANNDGNIKDDFTAYAIWNYDNSNVQTTLAAALPENKSRRMKKMKKS